jgi:UDP-2-acetamido-2,6-beta-L-arabino-hexul-4-ose reductase
MNKKIHVGITGQSGLVGTNLCNALRIYPDRFERIPFERRYFDNDSLLSDFVKQCDVIVHLAAVMRHNDNEELYKKNICLVEKLIAALIRQNVKPHIIYASSTQENLDNLYGKSKLKGFNLFYKWAKESNASFTDMIIPNVFGPFGRPNYNSFISTFCYRLTHNEEPQIIVDNKVNLIHTGTLCKYIIKDIETVSDGSKQIIKKKRVPSEFTKNVSEILELLSKFKKQYFDDGNIPSLFNKNEINLFTTFCSYIELESNFPKKLDKKFDERGIFVETIKIDAGGGGGQISFSITKPWITRGNHYHTRKIERFAVIKGKARIQLRRIDTDKVYEFYLDGTNPSYVDIPVWYTHNITNTGQDDLYTIFWINEWYDESNSDTFYEMV